MPGEVEGDAAVVEVRRDRSPLSRVGATAMDEEERLAVTAPVDRTDRTRRPVHHDLVVHDDYGASRATAASILSSEAVKAILTCRAPAGEPTGA